MISTLRASPVRSLCYALREVYVPLLVAGKENVNWNQSANLEESEEEFLLLRSPGVFHLDCLVIIRKFSSRHQLRPEEVVDDLMFRSHLKLSTRAQYYDVLAKLQSTSLFAF